MKSRRPSIVFWIWFIVWPVLASLLLLLIQTSFFFSVAIFFFPLTVVLIYLVPRAAPRAIVFSAFLFTPGAIMLDVVAHASHAWFAYSIFDSRIFSFAPWEDFFLSALIIMTSVLYYEYLYEHHKRIPVFGNRARYLFGIVFCMVCVFSLIWVQRPISFDVPYAYLWIGLIAIVGPISLELWRYRELSSKFLYTALYWAYVLLLYEFIGLYNSWWVFNGDQYLAAIRTVRGIIPIEEFVFWILLFVMAGLAWYEFFDDDNR